MDRKSVASIVILTGAGISKESGLSTFRDADGIWAKVRLEDVATPEAFERDPRRVQEFYNARRRGLLVESVKPNAAHLALADLERRWPGEVLVVTQNIDDLHERAGTRSLIHMHGELLKVRCSRTGRVYPWRKDVLADDRCECCASTEVLRPHVVWFGEMPFELDQIYAVLGRCGLFIAIGTSGQVYPAAGFVAEARRSSRAHTVLLNAEATDSSPLFEESILGPASGVVPRYVEELLSNTEA
jgi:NAD-dependent deacetylase